MNFGKAILGGVAGAIVMSLILFLARLVGVPINLSMMLGTMLGLEPGTATWLIGFVMHLILSSLIALVYAAGFEYVTHRAGAVTGIAFSLVHILLGGIFIGLVPVIHPLIPGVMAPPGAFLANLGPPGIFTFVVSHIVFGAIVGALYSPVRHPVAVRHA